MKKKILSVPGAALTLGCLTGCSRFATSNPTTGGDTPPETTGGQDVTINVYNWGQYIAEGG